MLLLVAGCSTERETNPQRTATEQLLISTAADHAVDQLKLNIKPGTKVFVDASNFDGTDAKYAIGLIRDHILRAGGDLVTDRATSDTVVEIRSGALSVDKSETLVGIPHFDIPVPLTGAVGIPEIALFKKSEQSGVAKFAATSYSTRTGEAKALTGPQYGISHNTDWVVLFIFSWSTNDLVPEQDREKALDFEAPDLNAYGR